MTGAAFSPERLAEVFRKAGLRLTRQRLFLGKLLFADGRNRHITAAALVKEAREHGERISLATIYNSLHQFVELGLLRQVVIDSRVVYFDTNLSEHHHFFHEGNGRLQDIPQSAIGIGTIPAPPKDTEIRRVDVVIHLQDKC